jgi:hypothetical protein
MIPRCHCRIKNHRIVFCRLHEATEGLYAAVDYLMRMLPGFEFVKETDRKMVDQVVLPYLERQLKAAHDPEVRGA